MPRSDWKEFCDVHCELTTQRHAIMFSGELLPSKVKQSA